MPEEKEESLQTKSAKNLRGAVTEEERKEAARTLGSITSERKAAAVRENGRLAPPGPGRTPRPIREYECTCGAGDSLEGHPTSCPRGLVIWRRRRQGKTVEL